MKHIGMILVLMLTPYMVLQAQNKGSESEIRVLLDEFLYGASIGDATAHERFWAEDLIYTSSAGVRDGKADIMAGFDGDQEINNDPEIMYTSEDVEVRFYGNTAVLTFTLVATPRNDLDETISYYYNSGVLVKRSGQWKVVNWQATIVPD